MYTDPRQVVEELAMRRRDQRLMNAVLEYLGGSLPSGWPEWPKGALVGTLNRYLATARVEDEMFVRMAASVGLTPCWLTNAGEPYIETNPEKASLVRPHILRPPGYRPTQEWLVNDHRQYMGKPIGDIPVRPRVEVDGHGYTRRAKRLVDVHSWVRQEVFGDPAIYGNVFDTRGWIRKQAARFGAPKDPSQLAPYYYHPLMALYICHGVLFEDFDGGPNADAGLARFVDEVVRPAIVGITTEFGMKPLIVRLPYIDGFLNYPPRSAATFQLFLE